MNDFTIHKQQTTEMKHVTVDINLSPDDCFICLEKSKSIDFFTMKCCRQPIHEECMFQLIINSHKRCPMCRKSIDSADYFDQHTFEHYVNELPYYSVSSHHEVINMTIQRLSFNEPCTCHRHLMYHAWNLMSYCVIKYAFGLMLLIFYVSLMYLSTVRKLTDILHDK